MLKEVMKQIVAPNLKTLKVMKQHGSNRYLINDKGILQYY